MNYETRRVLNNFKPRDYQIPIIDALENKGYKKILAILPRRAGKDIVAWNLSLRQCIKKKCTVFYIFPTYSQAKKVIWNSITNDGTSFHDFVPRELVSSKNSQEMKIEFVNGSILQLIGSDNIDCYDDKTEILTEDGWKLFKDLDKTEKVATLKDGYLEYDYPTHYVTKPYDGIMYHGLNRDIDFMVTPTHRFYVKSGKGVWKFKTITEVSPTGDCIPSTCLWKGNEQKEFTFPVFHPSEEGRQCEKNYNRKMKMVDFVALLGLYLSEGFTHKDYTAYKIIIFQKKVYARKQIEELLNNCEIKYRVNGFDYIIDDRQIYEYFSQFGGQAARFVPKEIKNLSTKYLKILFKWLVLGDGTLHCKQTQLYSLSKNLIDDMQEIAIKIGDGGNVSIKYKAGDKVWVKRDNRFIEYKHDLWQFFTRKSEFKAFASPKKKYIFQEKYNGTVHCVSVPSGVIKVRRNGKEIWSGNSIVGTNPYGCVFSEYALQDPKAYQFIRPILAANDGWALFISTPRGKNNFWELYQIALNHSEWFAYKLTLDDTRHIPLKEIEREREEGIMSEDLIQQEYYCFPSDQQILTKDGLKNISEIVVNELVYSHSGRLRAVKKTYSREYNGKLIKIKTYGTYEEIKCTPNHPIRVYNQQNQTYIWKKAIDIIKEDRLVFPKKQMSNVKIISYELCMLLAWYISDGSCFKNGIQFTINKFKSKRIEELLTSLNIEYVVYDKDCVNNVVINSVFYVDFFRSNCGTICYEKRIPFTLIIGFENDFFHELMKGDGCFSVYKGKEKFSFTTTSKGLAYQVQFLANSLNLGYAAGITRKKGCPVIFPGGRMHNTRDSYCINIYLTKFRDRLSMLIRAKYGIAAKIISIKTEEFSGNVFNLNIQYDESYVISGRAVHNCSFSLGVEGAYYTKYLDKMRISGQIGVVPYEVGFPVHTAWDLGVRDTTAIIFFQTIGQIVRIIDCYENSKEGLEHYVKIIKQKDYIYGKHIAPHDIRVKEFGSGMTRIEKAKQLGIKFIIAPSLSVEDGIESVRSAFSKIWIDQEKCSTLLKAINNYRQEYDSKKKVYKERPLHDHASNFSDSLRYLCITLPKTRDGLSAEELDKRYQEARFGTAGNLPDFFR